MVEDLPFAARRRRALGLLEAARHDVEVAGPQGEQVYYDEKGRRPKATKQRTEFIGYRKYLEYLQGEAGYLDPAVERMVRYIRAQRSFFDDGMPEEPGLRREAMPKGRR